MRMEAPALFAKIKTRGSLTVVIRPATFVEERVPRAELFELLSRCKVSLRGWDFPHVDRENPQIDVDWVGQAYQSEHMLELWRIHRSGQFVSISGIPSDWRDESSFWPATKAWQPNTVLGMMEVIARLTEVTEFAARLSQTPAGDEQMYLSVKLGMMAGRFLVMDSPRRSSLYEHRASVAAIPVQRSISRVDLVTNPREIALQLAGEVYSFFGWAPTPQIAHDMQREFLSQ
jgi:hypothetical protein